MDTSSPSPERVLTASEKLDKLTDPIFREEIITEPFVSGGFNGTIFMFAWMLFLAGTSIGWLVAVKGYVNQLTQFGYYLQASFWIMEVIASFGVPYVQRALDLWMLPTADGVAKVVYAGDLLLMINTNSAYLDRLSAHFGIEKGYVDALNVLVHFIVPTVLFVYASERGDARRGKFMGICTAERIQRIVLPMIVVFAYAGYENIAEVYETNSMGNLFLVVGATLILFINGVWLYW